MFSTKKKQKKHCIVHVNNSYMKKVEQYLVPANHVPPFRNYPSKEIKTIKAIGLLLSIEK